MNAKDRTPKNIAKKWIRISVLFYLISWILIGGFYFFYRKINMYGDYYENLFVNFFEFPGILVFCFGFFIDELLYFIKNKDYKKGIKIIIIIIIVFSVGLLFFKHSSFFRFYTDLNYAINHNYCEQIQDLKKIYLNEVTGSKSNTKTIYIETEEHKFTASEYIVQIKDFDRFKNKFSNCKSVRIKYMPNSNKLLSIEPVK